ncbi:type II secretion system protein [Candidatus Giovannonibacteria bacterium]|nr:type II secretion system protein [Candidatus Giovannonibacteria bacterium]
MTSHPFASDKLRRGFTLIETLIYIAILSVLIGSGMAGAFYIIDSSEKNKSDINAETEAHFLIRKIDWALEGADILNIPAPAANGPLLSVNKDNYASNPVVIDSGSGRARISKAGGAPIEITNTRVSIQNLKFEHLPSVGAKPPAIRATFQIGTKNFESLKYLRK